MSAPQLRFANESEKKEIRKNLSLWFQEKFQDYFTTNSIDVNSPVKDDLRVFEYAIQKGCLIPLLWIIKQPTFVLYEIGKPSPFDLIFRQNNELDDDQVEFLVKRILKRSNLDQLNMHSSEHDSNMHMIVNTTKYFTAEQKLKFVLALFDKGCKIPEELKGAILELKKAFIKDSSVKDPDARSALLARVDYAIFGSVQQISTQGPETHSTDQPPIASELSPKPPVPAASSAAPAASALPTAPEPAAPVNYTRRQPSPLREPYRYPLGRTYNCLRTAEDPVTPHTSDPHASSVVDKEKSGPE